MEFNDLILKRRSIREYQESSIDIETINEVINEAILAPSWKNTLTARFYVAYSNEYKDKVLACLPEFNQKSAQNNACLIVTTYVKKRSGFERDGNPTNELGDKWGVYDLGLNNSYLVLALANKGYDSLIMGIRDNEKLKSVFEISDSEEVVSVISIGKRKNDPIIPKRRELDKILVIK